MPQITYVQPDGARRSVAANTGATVMLTAVANSIPGIVAECGGAAMCATCHVYIDDASRALVDPVSEVENEMLDSAASGRRENSRLSCQLVLQPGVEQLIVHIPSHQV
ncbi:2Fe-2S iron-sulfur cluster-binding protein [Variovorax paradoxus]|uniref:2Fe-2S iron-sulfur cluster-binding protein n=1 Tax=Variovorax paradoxus TaxID=34073 RepID=UPI001F1C3F5A|nr:2Fe-2S iron-sulfur cluster-binding protein [Variovorax paradoxus]UKI08752.1 (2Fe-2S)-binding protein [Variovorax paradoxus]